MRKDNSTLLKKLKQYSALAAPMIAVAGLANGQAIYGAIDDTLTDDLGDNQGTAVTLDLDNDGTPDFVFAAFSSVQGASFNLNLAGAAPYSGNGNGILGYTAGGFYYPSALSAGVTVDQNQNFWEYFGSSVGTMVWYYLSSAGTFGQWSNVTDKYMGIKFLDGGGDLHYGWIRMDVEDNPVKIIFKDFAYNNTPDEGIVTGEGSPLAVQEVSNNSNEFGIFGFEGVANIIIKDGKYDNATITVINTMGQKVVDQKAMDKLTRIDLNQFGKGLYVVTIQRGSDQFSQKISFR